MGKGWDRHLFALKAMAEREKMPLPEFYKDPVYQRQSKIILSTSTLSSPALDGGGFGPVNDECYGIGYGIIVSRGGSRERDGEMRKREEGCMFCMYCELV